MNSDNDDEDYRQGCGQIKEAFRALTKDYILKPYISEKEFGSSKNGNDKGYNLYVLDITYQKNLVSAQPTEVEFKVSESIPTRIHGYSLVLRYKLVSISSDGQRHFNLM